MFYVYILSGVRRKYVYIGMTNDLQRRISQHQDGRGRVTAAYHPFKLVGSE